MLRTRVVWTGVAGTPYYSNFYWSGDSGDIAVEAQEQTIAWCADLGPFITTSLTLTVQPEVVGINAATGDIFDAFDVPGSSTIGSGAGEPLPFRTQALTRFGTTTFRRGRRVIGGSFVGGLLEQANVSGAVINEPFREGIQATYNEALRVGVASLVVWARPLEATGTKPALPGETALVTSALTKPTWSSLRTRGAN